MEKLISLNNTQAASSSRSTSTQAYTCGSRASGTYSGSGYYSYNNTLDLSGTPQGSSINLNINSYDIPNKFTVKDVNGNIILQTGWMGYVNYSGPWGYSLNTPQSQSLYFLRDASTTYILIVETSVQDYSDAWDASITCISGPSVTYRSYQNAQATDSVQRIFNTLDVNFAQLSAELGLSTTLSSNDIDFQNLNRGFSGTDSSIVALAAPFKANNPESSTRYAYIVYTDGVNYGSPTLAKYVQNETVQYFDLYDGNVTKILGINSSKDFSVIKTTGNYTTPKGTCGQRVSDCLGDIYSKNGWISVMYVASTFTPAGGYVFSYALGFCIGRECLRRQH